MFKNKIGLSYEVECKGDVEKAYWRVRKRNTVLFLICASLSLIIVPMMFGLNPKAWENLFFGINLFWLAILACIWGIEGILVYVWLSHWDMRKVKKSIEKDGLKEWEVVEDLNQGKIFFGEVGDHILVAPKYVVLAIKQAFIIVHSEEIALFAITNQHINGKMIEVLVCTLKDNRRYEVPLRKGMVRQVVDYYEMHKEK